MTDELQVEAGSWPMVAISLSHIALCLMHTILSLLVFSMADSPLGTNLAACNMYFYVF